MSDGRALAARAWSSGPAPWMLLGCILAAGCSAARTVPAPPAPVRTAAPVITVPFFAQRAYQCGPAALAMALRWSGADVTPQDLVGELLTPERKGTLAPDLIAAARRHDRIAYVVTGAGELHAELEAGNPVIVLQNLGLGWLPKWHYAVAIGYEPAAGDFVLHTGTHEARRVGEHTFENTWQRAGSWGLLVLPPDRPPATATELRWLEAAAGLETAGRVAAAATAYRAALERWPQSLAAGIGLANTLYAAADVVGAERALRATVTAHPQSADAWNNLAHVLAERGKVSEAKNAARTAVAIGGANADLYRHTLSELEAR